MRIKANNKMKTLFYFSGYDKIISFEKGIYYGFYKRLFKKNNVDRSCLLWNSTCMATL